MCAVTTNMQFDLATQYQFVSDATKNKTKFCLRMKVVLCMMKRNS